MSRRGTEDIFKFFKFKSTYVLDLLYYKMLQILVCFNSIQLNQHSKHWLKVNFNKGEFQTGPKPTV